MHKHATVTYLASLVKFKHATLAWCLIKDWDNFTIGHDYILLISQHLTVFCTSIYVLQRSKHKN